MVKISTELLPSESYLILKRYADKYGSNHVRDKDELSQLEKWLLKELEIAEWKLSCKEEI